MNPTNLADLRTEYTLRGLSRASVAADPFTQFSIWMNEAIEGGVPEPTAMTLATVGANGTPSSRVVLLKGFDESGFVFFTNYDSRKGSDIRRRPDVALSFFWQAMERQIHIEGVAAPVARSESEAYFASRPRESQIGAWASSQSSTVESREKLEEAFEAISSRFEGSEIPCPVNWGGFRVVPNRVEFWQGRPGRLHDRIEYQLTSDRWTIVRLSP